EPMIRDVAKGLLESQGYSVDTAENGLAAIKLYRERFNANNRFDAVILDLSMPNMSGQETAKKINTIDSSATCIVSSGYTNDRIVSDYTQYGFKARLPKPYDKQELLDVLEAVLTQQHTKATI
ncbi:MAG: response regulator, partial [Pseudomonadales bacterium]|nr:response regulator [Pseudomonadales bacterium]